MDKQYKIAPYLDVGFTNQVLNFGFGSKRKLIRDTELQKALLKASVYMQSPRILSQLKSYLLSCCFQEDISDEAITILKDGFLFSETAFALDSADIGVKLYYGFSGADPEKASIEISKKSVLILGCSGIGSIIAHSLASYGVRRLIFIDDSYADETFLYRQPFLDSSECGKPVSICLKNRIERCFDGVQIETKTIGCLKSTLDGIEKPDFVVHALMGSNSLQEVNRFCVNKKIPFISAGNAEDISIWGPLYIPDQTACIECGRSRQSKDCKQDQELKDLLLSIKRRYHPPTNMSLNMLTASLATLDIVKFLAGLEGVRSINKKIGLWTHDGHFEEQSITKNPNCTVCGVGC